MPPKQGSGKKLSQKEKDRLKKEAEEQRLREEEAARLQAEREERERKEREKQEEVERKKRENEENITRKAELLDLSVILDTNRSAIKYLKEENRKKFKWNRYMRCDGSPDPTVAGEINTFISLWKEDSTRVYLSDVLKDSILPVSLLEELDYVIASTPSEEISEKQLLQYRGTMQELRTLLNSKLDRACHELLCRASELADTETLNLQTVHMNETGSITVGIWGNLSKNPRIKQHEFVEKGFMFDIPRTIILSDSAVRAVFTSYDHYSPQSHSYHPRKKVKEIVEEPPKVEEKPAEQPVSAPALEPEPTTAKEDIMAALNALNDDSDVEAQQLQEEQVEKPPEDVVIEEDLVKTPEPPEWDDFDGEADDIDLREFQVVGDIIQFDLLHLPPQPKQMRGWVMTVMVNPPKLQPIEYVADQFITAQQQAQMAAVARRESAVPQSAMMTTPGPGTTAATSRLTTAHAGGRQSEMQPPASAFSNPAAPAPGEQPPPEAAAPKPPVQESAREKENAKVPTPVAAGGPAGAEKKEDKPLITVTIKLQQGVVFCDTPLVGIWDSKRNVWKRDVINEVVFKEAEKEIQFSTPMFGILALLQDKHINMPFQSWNLRPRAEPDNCILTVIASISELSIEVKGNMCCLCEPQENKQLRVFLNKWCTVSELIHTLQHAGVNIFPDCDSDKFVSTQDKNAIAVERLYQQMALVSTSVSFAWSRWNADNKRSDTIIVQACENLKDEPAEEDAYRLFAVTRKKVIRLKMSEFADTLNEEPDEITQFHADFYHMYVKEFGTEDGILRVQDSNYQYVDTVYELLKATNVLIFS